jgi:hypothetical protein
MISFEANVLLVGVLAFWFGKMGFYMHEQRRRTRDLSKRREKVDSQHPNKQQIDKNGQIEAFSRPE